MRKKHMLKSHSSANAFIKYYQLLSLLKWSILIQWMNPVNKCTTACGVFCIRISVSMLVPKAKRERGFMLPMCCVSSGRVSVYPRHFRSEQMWQKVTGYPVLLQRQRLLQEDWKMQCWKCSDWEAEKTRVAANFLTGSQINGVHTFLHCKCLAKKKNPKKSTLLLSWE